MGMFSTKCVMQVTSCFLIGLVGYTLISKHYGGHLSRSSAMTLYPGFIEKPSTDRYSFTLLGQMFDAKDSYQTVKAKISAGVVHWFTPYIESQAAEKFLGPPYENIYQANEAALVMHQGHVMLVARVWLNKKRLWIGTEDRKLGNKAPPQRNNFNDNWLYYQHFDLDMVPETYSSFLGIPAPSQYKYMDGPSDPRLFIYKEQSYLLFNMDMALNDTHDINYPVLWDFQLKGPVWIEIEGGSPFWNTGNSDYLKDRHWSPLVDGDDLYFIHSLDPLRVLSCVLEEEKCLCKFMDTPGSTFLFNEGLTHLRGGTPFLLYQWPYFVSFAQSALTEEYQGIARDNKVYNTHLVVLSVEPTFRIVYVSQGLKTNPQIFDISAKKTQQSVKKDGFILPVALIKEDLDTFCLSVNVNDESSVLLRLTGLLSLLQDVIKVDEYRKPPSGPIVNSVQEMVHKAVSLFNYTLVHKEI